VADYAALFEYAANQADYYLHLEDDVMCADSFIKNIRDYIGMQRKRRTVWAVLEFSELGFIGKLLRYSPIFMLIFIIIIGDALMVSVLDLRSLGRGSSSDGRR